MEEKFDLVAFRTARGFTQKDLAAALNINWKYISMIETGAKPLSNKLKAKLDQLQLNEEAPLKGQSDLAKASCPRCSEAALRISELERERDYLRRQLEALIGKLPDAKPSPAAAPACGAVLGRDEPHRRVGA